MKSSFETDRHDYHDGHRHMTFYPKDKYFEHLTNKSNLQISLCSTVVIVIMGLLKVYFDATGTEGLPIALVVLRFTTTLALIGYTVTLYRIKSDKDIVFSLRTCGNTTLVLFATSAGYWIYYSMQFREGPDITAKAVVSCLTSVCLNIFFPVHSPWAPAVVWLAQTLCFLIGAVGSSYRTFGQVVGVCILMLCVTVACEISQIESFCSYQDKNQLLLQLENKNEEMRALMGNVAHDLKVS
jgi:hypothetical protein